ncbi:hypothetical protein D3C80_2225950 [compost metagenome]
MDRTTALLDSSEPIQNKGDAARPLKRETIRALRGRPAGERHKLSPPTDIAGNRQSGRAFSLIHILHI